MSTINPESKSDIPPVVFTRAAMPKWETYRVSSERRLLPDGGMFAVLKGKELYQDRFLGLNGWELERAQQKRRATIVASFLTELGLIDALVEANRPSFEKLYAKAEEEAGQLSISDKVALVEDHEDSAVVGLINMLGRISDLDSQPRSTDTAEIEENAFATEAISATIVKEAELLSLKRGALYLLQQ